MRYQVVLHRTDEGISVSVPALPGCWSEGDTEEEALANIRDAIDDYLVALQDQYREPEVREVEFCGDERWDSPSDDPAA
ncbi:MAG: type II toxin-antitoxin system HicB family antitoxin [Candidatus Competibacteraceae bacterium]